MKQPTKTRLSLRVAALVMALVLAVGGLLSYSPVPTRADSLKDLQDQLKDLQEEEDRLKDELAAYKDDVEKQQAYADSLQEKIDNSEEQIDLLRQQIDLLTEQMDETAAEIAGKEADITAKENAIDAQIALFGERLRVIAQTGNVSTLQMLFSTDDFVDYLMKASVVSSIAASDQKMIDDLNEEIEALNVEKADLQQDKDNLESERAQVEELKKTADAKKEELDVLYAECNEVLRDLQSSVNAVNQALKKKQEEEERLDREIKRVLAAAAQNSSGRYTGGTMHWPVPAVRNISSYFGARWGTIHRGVDIANGSVPVYGQNIVAAADGEVIFVNASGWGGGYGLYAMVDHGLDAQGRQIVTLYAHMSAVSVSVGDKVVGGTSIIGRAGATGNVTGPHLHFEVRVNGTAVDPLANGYLKLS